jgi:hypothetical protein
MQQFNLKRIIKGGTANLLSLACRILIQFVQVPILYSAWHTQKASIWLVLWTLPNYMALTVSALSAAGGNLAVEKGRQGDVDGVRSAYRATSFAITISNLVLVLICAVAYPFLFQSSKWNINQIELLKTIAFISIYVVIRVQTATLELVYRYGEDYGGFIFYETAATIGELLVTFVVVNLTGDMAFLPASLAALRLVTFSYMYVRAKLRWSIVFQKVDRTESRKMLRTMLVPFLGFLSIPLLLAINLQGYSLIVSAFFGPAVFATFLTIRMLARLVDQWCNMAYAQLFYELSYADFAQSRDAAIGVTALVTAILVVAGAAYSGILLFFGQWFEHFWTRGMVTFSPSLVIVFCCAGIIRAASVPVTAMLSARNAHAPMAAIYLTFSIIAIALAVSLASAGFGVTWVCACVIIAEFSQTFVGYRFVAKLLGISSFDLLREMAILGPRYAYRLPSLLRRRDRLAA